MLLEFRIPPPTQSTTIPSTQETQLRIRQTLDVDPEINFINWELNIQDVAAATARSAHARGLLSLVLNPTQWDTHVSNVSINDQGQSVRWPLPRLECSTPN